MTHRALPPGSGPRHLAGGVHPGGVNQVSAPGSTTTEPRSIVIATPPKLLMFLVGLQERLLDDIRRVELTQWG